MNHLLKEESKILLHWNKKERKGRWGGGEGNTSLLRELVSSPTNLFFSKISVGPGVWRKKGERVEVSLQKGNQSNVGPWRANRAPTAKPTTPPPITVCFTLNWTSFDSIFQNFWSQLYKLSLPQQSLPLVISVTKANIPSNKNENLSWF